MPRGGLPATPAMRSRSERLARVWPWIAGLVGASLFLRPLWGHPDRSVLDREYWYDALVNIDDLAELHRSFLGGRASGQGFWDWLYSGHFFYPQPRPLITSELMPLAALVTLPFSGHPVLGHNVALFVAVVLNCVAGASFARVIGARPLAATVAGVSFAFCSYTNFVSSRLQLMCLFPLAWALAATVDWAKTGRWRPAMTVAGWAFVQAMLCLYYAIFLAFALPFVALAARLAVRRPGLTRDALRLVVCLTAVLLPTALLLWPYRDLSGSLGLGHSYDTVIGQAGDLQTLGWADPTLLLGSLLKDQWNWDSVYFPGVVVLLGVALAAGSWVLSDPRWRWPFLVAPLGIALGLVLRVLPVALGLTAACVVAMMVLARRGRSGFAAPLLLALLLAGWILFGGPEPKLHEQALGASPYAWMYRHLPFFDGIRMIRRAGVIIQLALCGVAALGISRIERRRSGWLFAAPALCLAFLEGMPLTLAAHPVAKACTDKALQRAHADGIAAVGNFTREHLPHLESEILRHQATLCGTSVTVGFSGVWPSLGDLATDAVLSLPDPAAHAWLWKAGVRHVVVRHDSKQWLLEGEQKLQSISQSVQEVGPDALVALKPPLFETFEATAHLDGARVQVLRVECSTGRDCKRLIDGDEKERWTSGRAANGNEAITLHFAESQVGGLEWHDTGFPRDLPRGLRVEALTTTGLWAVVREIPGLSPLQLGRNAQRPAVAISFSPTRTSALRVTQTGKSRDYWLSATELQVVGAVSP